MVRGDKALKLTNRIDNAECASASACKHKSLYSRNIFSETKRGYLVCGLKSTNRLPVCETVSAPRLFFAKTAVAFGSSIR